MGKAVSVMQIAANIMEEVRMFLYAAGLGAVMTMTYEVLRLTRKIFPRGLVWISIEDVCFWLVFSILFWEMTYCRMDGRLRLYVILSMLLGLRICFGICSGIKKTLKKCVKADKMIGKKRSRKKGE